MASLPTLLHLLFLLPFTLGINQNDFLQCMSNHSSSTKTTNNYTHPPNSPSYFKLLKSSEQNPRWLNSTKSRPKFIVTPYKESQIQQTITCAKKLTLQIRVKSGGHDYEGLSYRSENPFILVDLINLRSITVDIKDQTAWVEAGASLGEVYHTIAEKSNIHAFPAGLYPSVGVGGHVSAGGIGTLMRKYGLAADNIVDAYIMNTKGEILDRKSMGEDLFWAIRGGGGASFGVILAWKIKLVKVPPIVTVFTVSKNLDRQGIKLVDKWQRIAPRLSEDLFIRVLLFNLGGDRNRTAARVSFNSLFLGTVKDLLPLVQKSFPELGLQEKDCTEMSWINSTLYFSNNKGKPLEVLLNRTVKATGGGFKGKSDFAYKPLPESALRGINKRLIRDGTAFVIMDPFGGKMDEISETELPFPHRKGNLFNIQYLFQWSGDDEEKKHLDRISELFDFMEPFVSSSPRAAYLNYKDLDIGFNQKEKTSYSEAAIWGTKYFKGNFERLAKVKKVVDPENFFRNEQSIPPMS